jgi:hypothetical protein
MDALKSRCKQSLNLLRNTHSLIPASPLKSARHTFARKAIDLSSEYHFAIGLTMSMHSHATATALLRPLLEVGSYGYWFLYFTPSDHLKEIAVPGVGRDIPILSNVLNDLDKVPSLKKLKVKNLIESLRNDRIFDKLTHSGKIQLFRRMYPETYALGSNLYTMALADRFALLAAAPSALLYPETELSLYFEEKLNQSTEELSKITGEEITDRWPGLPPPPEFKDEWDDGSWLERIHQWMIKQRP